MDGRTPANEKDSITGPEMAPAPGSVPRSHPDKGVVKNMWMTRLKATMAVLVAAIALAGFVRSDDPATSPADALRGKLKKYESEVAKIRQAMLQECTAEEQRLEEAKKKAKEDMDRAKKGKDTDAFKKADAASKQATAEKTKVTAIRNDIEKRIQLDPNSPLGKPIEERVGFKVATLTPLVRVQLGLSANEGLAVDKVDPDTVAAKMGLKTYDVLVKVDDKPVMGNVPALRALLGTLKGEKGVDVVVMRRGKAETLKGLTVPPVE